MQALDVFWVGMGGGAGSLLRWWIGRLVGEKYSGNFPLATFLINISGAFVIGFLSISFGVEWHDRFGDFLTSGILTGVLGGYTTFSSMQLDAVKLAKNRYRGAAIIYLLGSVVIGLLAAGLGAKLAHAIV